MAKLMLNRLTTRSSEVNAEDALARIEAKLDKNTDPLDQYNVVAPLVTPGLIVAVKQQLIEAGELTPKDYLKKHTVVWALINNYNEA